MMRQLLWCIGISAVLAICGCKDSPTAANGDDNGGGNGNGGGGGDATITHVGSMVHLAGGTFQMGSINGDADEQPPHAVTVSAFYMDTTEVTYGDYQSLMYGRSSIAGDSAKLPAFSVSWYNAVLYCNRRSRSTGLDTVYSYASVVYDTQIVVGGFDTLTGAYDTLKWFYLRLNDIACNVARNGYRLPTEAEWEYACRAGTTTDCYWGRNYPPTTREDSLAIDSNAVWYYGSNVTLQPAASKKPNKWDLYDMNGNVCEWCNDWYGPYSSNSQSDPMGPDTGSERVARGGGVNHTLEGRLCSTYRFMQDPKAGHIDHGTGNLIPGFRCVRR